MWEQIKSCKPEMSPCAFFMKTNMGSFTSQFCDLTAQCSLTFTLQHFEPVADPYMRKCVMLMRLTHLCSSAAMTKYFSVDNCFCCCF